MKPYLALLLFSLQFELFLFADAAEPEKRVVGGDLLSHVSCQRIKTKGYCTRSFIKNKLCYATCRCRNVLSPRSCNIVKARNQCQTPFSITLCRFTCNQCSRVSCKVSFPLGMKSKAIPDARITASSMWDKNHSPARGRLGTKQAGVVRGGWSAATNNVHQWLQVDLGEVTKVTHVATQGRQDSYYNQWVRSYRLQYSSDGRRFVNYKGGKVFKGNSDQNTVVKHALKPAIIARYIRVRPKTWYTHISMRVELYGCI